MSVPLAFGLTAGAGLRCWLPTSGGRVLPRPAEDRAGAHPPGAPVAVGPAVAGPEVVREACRQLVLLTGKGNTAAAAGVDLGGGFISARLAGAHGDRRDAVLAALRVLGADGAHRLGDRSASLVALFGPSATKRVGAAAHTAVAEARWAALRLASAASDLLGPEQVERLLELRAPDGIDPDGIDPFPRGAASTLAGHLSLVLAGCPRPRRLALVLSLWQEVCARLVQRQRLARLAAKQARADRIDKLRDRIATLTGDAPLPRSLRALVRRPEIAPAHAMDVVARAVRAAVGELARDAALCRSVARRPAPELVCALAIAATCATRSTMDGVLRVTEPRKVTVPGFPAGDLFDEDGPWQRALAAAAELGAPVEVFAERVAEHGLLIPSALLGKGGWPALWRRAHR